MARMMFHLISSALSIFLPLLFLFCVAAETSSDQKNVANQGEAIETANDAKRKLSINSDFYNGITIGNYGKESGEDAAAVQSGHHISGGGVLLAGSNPLDYNFNYGHPEESFSDPSSSPSEKFIFPSSSPTSKFVYPSSSPTKTSSSTPPPPPTTASLTVSDTITVYRSSSVNSHQSIRGNGKGRRHRVPVRKGAKGAKGHGMRHNGKGNNGKGNNGKGMNGKGNNGKGMNGKGRPNRPPTQSPTKFVPSPPLSTRPTLRPTRRPTFRPTLEPTRRPTPRPTPSPTRRPTRRPTFRPTRNPTRNPTPLPTPPPTEQTVGGTSAVSGIAFSAITDMFLFDSEMGSIAELEAISVAPTSTERVYVNANLQCVITVNSVQFQKDNPTCLTGNPVPSIDYDVCYAFRTTYTTAANVPGSCDVNQSAKSLELAFYQQKFSNIVGPIGNVTVDLLTDPPTPPPTPSPTSAPTPPPTQSPTTAPTPPPTMPPTMPPTPPPPTAEPTDLPTSSASPSGSGLGSGSVIPTQQLLQP